MSDQEKIDGIKIKYQEVCESHRAISVFRGKLLALLPFATGGAVAIIIPETNGIDAIYVVSIGIFGFFVTLGLFLHEIRGIRHCGDLLELGASLEEKMSGGCGHFISERKYYHDSKGMKNILNNLVGPVGAAAIIYPSVCISWLYLIVVALELSKGCFTLISLIVFITVLILLLIFLPHHNNND